MNRAKENYMEIENAKRLISSRYFWSIDLCGNESIPANNYVDLYKYAAKYGVILKAHVGEFGTIEVSRRGYRVPHPGCNTWLWSGGWAF